MSRDDARQTPRLGGDSGPKRPRRFAQFAVIGGAILLVAGPVLYFEFPREIGRWYRAASDEQRLNGEIDAAIEHLTTAIAWDAQSAELLVRRAELKSQRGNWQGALEDCDRARQLSGGARLAVATRTECLHSLGRDSEAVQQWRDLLAELRDELGDLDRAQLLNGFAYACAVGNLGLDEAVLAADEAIQLSVNEAALLDPEGVLYAGRAMVEVELGRLSEALISYQRAGNSASAAFEREKMRFDALSTSGAAAEEYARRVAALRPHLAGILTVRAELLEKLKKPNEAKLDRERLDSLAIDGNLSVALPVGLSEAMLVVANNAAILDTRGLLYYHVGDLERALQDTENAVVSAEWQMKAFEWFSGISRSFTVDLRLQEEQKRLRARSVAVICYHRMLVLEKLGKTDLAAKDRARIVQLGYEPSEELF
jgi:tetratricopeptide (TPR) repeat protein